MDVLDTVFSRMTFAAREYCELIDNVDSISRGDWLARMSGLLPRLHDAVIQLKSDSAATVKTRGPDFDERFELFSRLYERFGEREGFDADFDGGPEGRRLSGSLADDFTDIYFDLKRGLQLLQEHAGEPNVAIAEWQRSFQLHWRHHLDDAQRQLDGLMRQEQRSDADFFPD